MNLNLLLLYDLLFIYNHRAALQAHELSEHKEFQLWRIVFGVLHFVAYFKLSVPPVISFWLGLDLRKRGAALTWILPWNIPGWGRVTINISMLGPTTIVS